MEQATLQHLGCLLNLSRTLRVTCHPHEPAVAVHQAHAPCAGIAHQAVEVRFQFEMPGGCGAVIRVDAKLVKYGFISKNALGFRVAPARSNNRC